MPDSLLSPPPSQINVGSSLILVVVVVLSAELEVTVASTLKALLLHGAELSEAIF